MYFQRKLDQTIFAHLAYWTTAWDKAAIFIVQISKINTKKVIGK